MDTNDIEELAPHGLFGPCAAAMGVIGVPARRWATRVDLYAQIERARSLLDTCPLEGISITELAGEAGLSRHHFLRLFHEVERVTPHRYLNQRRVAEANRLMLESDLNLSEIAIEVGFGSLSAFGRLYRSITGETPSEARKRFSQQRSSMSGSDW